jgi:hypothetical protein
MISRISLRSSGLLAIFYWDRPAIFYFEQDLPDIIICRLGNARFSRHASIASKNISRAKIGYLGRYVDQPPMPHAASIKPW